MDGIPYKALYNDIVEKEFTTEQAKVVAEAGRIYGCNSINDSQFFAASREAVPALVKALQEAVACLEECAKGRHEVQTRQSFFTETIEVKTYAAEIAEQSLSEIATILNGRVT
jgi:hypothetical protein